MSDSTSSKPGIGRGLLFLAVIGVCFALIAVFVLSQRTGGGAINIPEGKPDPLPVNVARAIYTSDLQVAERYTGLVFAKRSSSLGFETGGRIASIDADVGDRVASGAILARLDTRALRARLSAAEAQITEAQASLGLAEATIARQQALVDKGLLSGQAFDETEAQADAALARVNAAEAQADTLRVQLRLAAINAPFSGVITQRRMDEGAIASPGQPVLQLVEDGALEALIGVPAQMAGALVPGDAYDLVIGSKTVTAELRAVTGVIERGQRTVNTVFDLEGGPGIQPGAVARLELDRGVGERGFWVPVSSMTESSRGLWAVFAVVDVAGQSAPVIEKRLVDLVHAEADRAFVRGAIEDGDIFVVNGLQRLTPGLPVEPKMVSDEMREGRS